MWKVILTYVHIKGEIMYPYVYGFLNCYGNNLPLPTNNAEVVQYVGVAVMDW